MNAQFKPVRAATRRRSDSSLGLTQVVTRNWLMALNYSYDFQKGYQTDPYRVISVVDPNTGEPTSYAV